MSAISSQVLILTSTDGGSADKTNHIHSISGQGSARLHLAPLFHVATKLKLQPRLLSLDSDDPSMLSLLGYPKICIIGKVNHFDDKRVEGFSMAILAAIARLKSRGVKIVSIYCDNLAPLSCIRGTLYRDILRLSDFCIVPCIAMEHIARKWLPMASPVFVIEDPWQTRLQPYPSFHSTSKLRIVWFGNTNNVHFLCLQLKSLMENLVNARSVLLSVLTNQQGLDLAHRTFLNSLPSANLPWSFQPHLWRHDAQPTQLESVLGPAHISWLPSDPSNVVKSGVSHNRLIDSVRSGCIAIASPMSSYLELSKIAILGRDHATLINSILPEYDRLSMKYTNLRSQILQRFSPAVNLSNWEKILISIIGT